MRYASDKYDELQDRIDDLPDELNEMEDFFDDDFVILFLRFLLSQIFSYLYHKI